MMGLTPEEISNRTFDAKFRGYDAEQVQQFLNEVAQDYQAIVEQNRDLERQLAQSKEKITYFSDLKDALNQSILVAQNAADRVKTNADKEAAMIHDEAEKKAQQIVGEAQIQARHLVQEAADRATRLGQETADLRKDTKVFHHRLKSMLESQLELITNSDWNELLADPKVDVDQLFNNESNSTVAVSADVPSLEPEHTGESVDKTAQFQTNPVVTEEIEENSGRIASEDDNIDTVEHEKNDTDEDLTKGNIQQDMLEHLPQFDGPMIIFPDLKTK